MDTTPSPFLGMEEEKQVSINGLHPGLLSMCYLCCYGCLHFNLADILYVLCAFYHVHFRVPETSFQQHDVTSSGCGQHVIIYLFVVSVDYSCSYRKNTLPRQGWVYLSVNHLAFYSFFMGSETMIVLRWSDVTVSCGCGLWVELIWRHPVGPN